MLEVNAAPLRKRLGGRPRKYPFRTMEVGEYFFVPDKVRNTLAPYACNVGREHNRKFRTRLTFMRETLEGWVPCKEDVDGAVLGVGVWRVA